MAVNGSLRSWNADEHAGGAADGQNIGHFDAKGKERIYSSTLRTNLLAHSCLFTAVRLCEAFGSADLSEKGIGDSSTLSAFAVHSTAARLHRRTETDHHICEAGGTCVKLSHCTSTCAVHQACDTYRPEAYTVVCANLSETIVPLCTYVSRCDAESLPQEV